MKHSCNDLRPHPQFWEILFAYRSRVSNIFKEILGLYEINHISLTRISNNQLLTLSSTPAMEFNLFNSSLWRYDLSYNPKWYKQCTQDYWETLYHQKHYDELYYLKQIKHTLPLGLSFANQIGKEFVIYSLASHKSCPHTLELFTSQKEEFNKIGTYCSSMLDPIFSNYPKKSSST
jgi:hypothetical protein